MLNLLGDDQRYAAERGIDQVHPVAREMLSPRRAVRDRKADRGRHEVHAELCRQRGEQQPRAGIARRRAGDYENGDRADRKPGVSDAFDQACGVKRAAYQLGDPSRHQAEHHRGRDERGRHGEQQRYERELGRDGETPGEIELDARRERKQGHAEGAALASSSRPCEGRSTMSAAAATAKPPSTSSSATSSRPLMASRGRRTDAAICSCCSRSGLKDIYADNRQVQPTGRWGRC